MTRKSYKKDASMTGSAGRVVRGEGGTVAVGD